MTSREREKSPGETPTASLKLRVEPRRIPWIFASLRNTPQVELYNGEFPEPFTHLSYFARHEQGQLVLATALRIGEDFNNRYGPTVGTSEDLAPLLARYPEHQFLADHQQLVLQKDGQVLGVIARTEDNIIIQRGGTAGQLPLTKDRPVNSLSVYLDQFNLLVQRYVGAVWKSFPETDQRKLNLVLDLPALPEGAPATYFSTFEILASEFRARPRPVDLETEIGGYPDVKATVKALVMDLAHPDASRSYGTQPFSNKFILVTGVEGTGKSLFPKALDVMLRARFKEQYEHFRLPLADIIQQYGPYAASAVTTVLDHVRENEKKGIFTLLHLDNLEQLIPPHQRPRGTNANLALAPGYMSYFQSPTTPSDAEFNYFLQTINPLVSVLRQLGRDLGGESHHTVIYGESRAARELLPEGVARTFRRAFSLDNPTDRDLAGILGVQIRTTRKFAESTKYDPCEAGIEKQTARIAPHARGLVGRDIQQAFVNICTRAKAEDGTFGYKPPITEENVIEEVNKIRLAKALAPEASRGRLGLPLPHWKNGS